MLISHAWAFKFFQTSVNWIEFIGCRDVTSPMHWDLGRSIVLKSISRMDKIKATLPCHFHVSRSGHHGTAAINTTPVIILPVLDLALGRRMAISHFRLYTPVEESTRCAPRFASYIVRLLELGHLGHSTWSYMHHYYTIAVWENCRSLCTVNKQRHRCILVG